MYNNIILHIPHSSDDFSLMGWPEGIVKSFQEQARDLIDWYTDELFLPVASGDERTNQKYHLPDKRIIPVVFNTCRSLCDVERLSHDPLEKSEQGIIGYRYMQIVSTRFQHRHMVNVRLTPEEKNRILHEYLEHQNRVAGLLVDHPGSLLLDCHSFSNRPTALQPDNAKSSQTDICIGFNEDFSKPEAQVLELVKDHFEKLGYKVGVNTPFSNAKTVDTPVYYHSLMIEVNKSLYMDEDTLLKTSGFNTVAGDIRSVYNKLLFKQKIDITLPSDIRTPKEILEYCDYDVDQLRSALLKLSADEIRQLTWTLDDICRIPTPMSRIVYDALMLGRTPSQDCWPDNIRKEIFDWINIIHF